MHNYSALRTFFISSSNIFEGSKISSMFFIVSKKLEKVIFLNDLSSEKNCRKFESVISREVNLGRVIL